MATFNVDTFLEAVQPADISTAQVLVPAGEYPARIDSFDKPMIITTGAGETRYKVNVNWAIEDDDVRELTGYDKPIVRQNLWLDLNEEGTALDNSPGKNVKIGQLLEALGMDVSKPWSFPDLLGQSAIAHVTHNPGTGANADVFYANVTRVAPF